jgi:type IV secretory pathway VirB10-like protein
MSFRTKLKEHLTALPVREVRRVISKYNKELDIKPTSRLKKADIIEMVHSKKPMDKVLLAKLTKDAETARKNLGQKPVPPPKEKKKEPEKKSEPEKSKEEKDKERVDTAVKVARGQRLKEKTLREVERAKKRKEKKAGADERLQKIKDIKGSSKKLEKLDGNVYLSGYATKNAADSRFSSLKEAFAAARKNPAAKGITLEKIRGKEYYSLRKGSKPKPSPKDKGESSWLVK